MKTTDKLLTLGACLMGALLLVSLLACSGDAGEDPAPPESSNDVCGGIQGLTCQNTDEVCIYAQSENCGRYDRQGTCHLPSELCTREYAPVCGCDGQTYNNECEAHGAGVSVESQGECATAGQACGARLGDTCAADEVCVFTEAAQCGWADATGNCQPKPQFCAQIYDPVCGCDGQTYSNECMALAADVSVQHQGSCQTPGGCTDNSDCASGDYCAFDSSDQCGAAGQGTCETRPEACTQHYDPVCGCDGNTYSNSCMAASYGVSVVTLGACVATQ